MHERSDGSCLNREKTCSTDFSMNTPLNFTYVLFAALGALARSKNEPLVRGDFLLKTGIIIYTSTHPSIPSQEGKFS